MVLRASVKERILTYYERGLKPLSIQCMLGDKRIFVSRVGIWKFLRVYRSTSGIA